MGVPDYESVMLPLLSLVADQREHSLGEVTERLALKFNLKPEDRGELLPSGVQAKFDNRVGWARTYLKKAGLIEYTGGGAFRITLRGKEVLANNPTMIGRKYLERFSEFREFQRAAKQDNAATEAKLEETNLTPQETLELSYQAIRRNVTQDLLERVKKCSPSYFERIVVDLLVAMGYGGSRKDAGKAVGRSGDGGIDGIINEDRLGLDVIYIQAKRWGATVGRETVQSFAGSLDMHRATKGVVVTTSQFSRDAREYVQHTPKKIVLIDGEQLAQYMIDHGVGVNIHASYVVKKIDVDYFGEE